MKTTKKTRALAAILGSVMLVSVAAGCSTQQSSQNSQIPSSSAPAQTSSQPAPESWTPKKQVEWVVTSNPGGGSDIYTRMIADILKSEKLVDQTILVNNQTDGGGEVGRRRVSQEKNDGHLLLTFNSGDLSPMVKNTTLRMDGFKPVAVLAIDRQILLKGNKTKYKDFAEAIEAAKGGTQVVIGGSKGDDIATYNKMLNSIGVTEAQMPYLMYDSTSDAQTALLGGHVEFCISKPAAAMQYIESKDVTPVVALATERFGSTLKDVPLLSEIGSYEDVESPVWRGVVASKSMPDELLSSGAKL